MAQYHLRDATPDDAVAMTRVATDAFNAAKNKVDSRLFPDHLRTESSEHEAFDWRVNSLRPVLDRAKRPDAYGTVAIHSREDGSEEIIGWAQWQRPVIAGEEMDMSNSKTKSLDDRFQDARERGGGFPSAMDASALRIFAEASERFKMESLGEEGDKDMWTLQTIAVSPSHQRRGVGSMLVRWGLNRAKETGKDVYLLGTGPGRELYLSLGFEDLVSNREILGEMHYSMIKRVGSEPL